MKNIINTYGKLKISFLLFQRLQFIFLGIITPLWITKDLVVMVKICAELENFYKSIEEVQSTCILLLTNENCSGKYCIISIS